MRSDFTRSHNSVFSTLREAWRIRRAWWFTATSRTRARLHELYSEVFGLVFPIYSIGVLALVYGTVFKVQDLNVCCLPWYWSSCME